MKWLSFILPATKHDIERLEKQMKTIADLEAEIKADLTDAANAITAKLNDLATQLASGNDVTQQVTELQTIAQGLRDAVAKVNNPPSA